KRRPKLILLGIVVGLRAQSASDVNLGLGIERVSLQCWIRFRIHRIHRIKILKSRLSESEQLARPRPCNSRQLSMTSNVPASHWIVSMSSGQLCREKTASASAPSGVTAFIQPGSKRTKGRDFERMVEKKEFRPVVTRIGVL